MASTAPHPAHQPGRWLRENTPLVGVSLVLLLAFAVLALAARGPWSMAGGFQRVMLPAALAAELAELPGNADDSFVVVSELDPDRARARNAAVAFAPEGPGRAPPFAFRGNGIDRMRARDCLALAAMAEAGGGDPDQRAVIQVILNRVRHPAFAKTVCGVVFEGSQRATGCQFSFTCDGSLARRYPAYLWTAARQRAEEALGGYVHKPVGNATHYHTDWVYPWWSGKLDKIAQVKTHLFFRWRGYWGSTAALNARYGGGEPDPDPLKAEAQAVTAANPMASFADTGEALKSFEAAAPSPAVAAETAAPAPRQPAAGVHLVLVSPGDSPAALVERARSLCAGGVYCQVYGWSDAADMPARLPLGETARALLRFSFRSGGGAGSEAVYIDCRMWASPGPATCLPRARP